MDETRPGRVARLFRILAPLAALALLLLPAPEGLGETGWRVAAVGLLMAAWWMSEALPLAATALLPLPLFPALGILPIEETAAAYANPLVFLFLGGFLLALALSVWGLDRRLAAGVLRRAGRRPKRLVAAVMAVTAFLSLWISNTATAMVMLPIGQALAAGGGGAGGEEEGEDRGAFATALLLGIAYAATIGGMGTLIGTPPNALFAAYMAETQGIEIGFAEWMLLGVPLVLLLLPLAWWVLTGLAFRLPQEVSVAAVATTAPSALGRPERRVALVLLDPARSTVLINDHELITAGFISNPDLRFPRRASRPAGLLPCSRHRRPPARTTCRIPRFRRSP